MTVREPKIYWQCPKCGWNLPNARDGSDPPEWAMWCDNGHEAVHLVKVEMELEKD